MLLRMHLISSLFVQIGAFLTLLFVYFNPFVKKMPSLLQKIAEQKRDSALIKEERGAFIDIWTQEADTSYHYHLFSPKMETWIEREKNSSQFIEKAYDLELTLTQSIHKTPFTELCSLSSEKGYIDMKRCNLSLINASILFDTLPDQKKPPSGNGFAKFVTISDIFSSPSIQMKEFSGYLNFSKETL